MGRASDKDLAPGAIPVPADVETLRRLCREFRKDLLDLTIHSGTGSSHIGGELSLVEILAVLFFHTLRLDPRESRVGGPRSLPSVQGARLGGHVRRHGLAGLLPAESGCSIRSTGRTASCRSTSTWIPPGRRFRPARWGWGCRRGSGWRGVAGYRTQHEGASPVGVFAVLSDGECTAGQTWEAAMSAAHFGLDNLVAVVDDNNRFVTGPRNAVMTLDPFGAKWAAFGWHVLEVDGHDLPALIETLATARRPETAPGKPRVVLAHTVKGKGVSFMEASDGWHAGHLTAEQYQAAMAEVAR